jgi:hypothetical protein
MKKWFAFVAILLTTGLFSCVAPTDRTGDSTNGYTMSLVGSYVGTEDIASIFVLGDYVYAAAKYDGLIVLCATNPSNLTKVANATYTKSNFPINDVIVKTVGAINYAFVVFGNEGGKGGFAVLDVTDLTNITEVGSVVTLSGWNPVQFALNSDNSIAFVADYNKGFSKVDTDSAGTFAAPAGDTTLTLGGPAVDLVFDGTYCYVAARTAGVYVVTPGALTAASTINAQISTTLSFANAVAYSTTTLVIADRISGILVYNISAPNKPKYRGAYDTTGDAFDVVVDGTDVFVADGSNGLLWLDINNPAVPTLRASAAEASAIAYKVFYNTGTTPFIFAAYGPKGVRVYMKTAS